MIYLSRMETSIALFAYRRVEFCHGHGDFYGVSVRSQLGKIAIILELIELILVFGCNYGNSSFPDSIQAEDPQLCLVCLFETKNMKTIVIYIYIHSTVFSYNCHKS